MRIIFSFFLFFSFNDCFSKPKIAKPERISLSVGSYFDYSVKIPSKGFRFRGNQTGSPIDGKQAQKNSKNSTRKIFSYEYLKKQKVVRFYGSLPGSGTLVVQDKGKNILYDFRVDVVDIDLFKIKKEVEDFLKDVDGLSINVFNNKITLDGEVIRVSDFNRINQAVIQFEGKVDSFARLSRHSIKNLIEIIQREIPYPNVTVIEINRNISAKGVVGSEEERQKVWDLIKYHLPDKPIPQSKGPVSVQFRNQLELIPDKNLLKIKQTKSQKPPAPKMIEITVRYVEMQKDYLSSFNFNWSPSLNDGSQIGIGANVGESRVPSSTTSLTATIDNFIPKLNWVKTHGFARVVQQGMIITQDKQTGKLFSGGQIFVPISGGVGGSSSVQQIDTGFNIQVKPEIQAGSHNIKLTINLKVTSPGSVAGSSINVNTNTLSTEIAIGHNQTAAVGGISIDTQSKDFNRPVDQSNTLFNFNSSKGSQKNQKQFVVFLTPSIKISPSQGVDRIRHKFGVDKSK